MMNRTLKRIRFLTFLLVLACFVGMGGFSAQAVSESPASSPALHPLTPENIHELTQIAQIGKGALIEAAWSPDGEMVALATGVGIYLYNGHTLEFIALLPTGYAGLVSWSADSTLLAVCSSPGDDIQLWNVAQQDMLFSIEQKRTISAIAIDQEKGEILALGQQEAGHGDYNVPLYKSYLDTYNLKNGKRKSDVSFQSSDKQLLHLTLSPGGKTIFGVGLQEYYIWNFKGKQLYKAPVSMPMGTLGVSDGSLVAVLNMMNTKSVQVINLKKKDETAEIKLEAWAADISLDDTGKKLVVYTSKGYQVYNLASLELETMVPYKQYLTGDLRISGDLTRLLVAEESRLKLIDLSTGEILGEQDGFLSSAQQVAAGNGRLAASKVDAYTQDVQFFLWELGTLQELNTGTPQNLDNTITELFFTPDGSQLLTFARYDNAVRFWNAHNGTADREMEFENKLTGVCLSADGKVLAVGLGGLFEVWPLQGTAPDASLYMESTVTILSLSADGSRVAASTSFEIVVLDVPQNEMLIRFANAMLPVSEKDEVSFPVLSPDGQSLAVLYSGKKGHTIKLYNLDTGKVEWTSTLGDYFKTMAFSPDGSMLAVSAYGNGLIFLDAQSGKNLFTLDYVSSDFSISSDSCLIVTASIDGTVRAWGVQ